jgi:hypothetical protein
LKRISAVIRAADLLQLRVARIGQPYEPCTPVVGVGFAADPPGALEPIQYRPDAGAVYHEDLSELALAQGPVPIVVQRHQRVELRVGDAVHPEEAAPDAFDAQVCVEQRDERRLLEVDELAVQRDLRAQALDHVARAAAGCFPLHAVPVSSGDHSIDQYHMPTY